MLARWFEIRKQLIIFTWIPHLNLSTDHIKKSYQFQQANIVTKRSKEAEQRDNSSGKANNGEQKCWIQQEVDWFGDWTRVFQAKIDPQCQTTHREQL